ncbi:MAG TPA: efflux RND transporter permease subunit, partial [Gemmataceae bacterium]|nr:efflux RND transporter permease subunit [Gemmataceae bacterium]
NVEGEVLRVRDVGKVTVGPVGTPDECTADGKPAVALVVYLAADASPAKVRARLATRLAWLREDLPPGMTLQSDFDFTPFLGMLRKPAGADYAVVDLHVAPYLRAGPAKEVLAKCEAAVRGAPGVRHTLALSDNPFDVFGNAPCLLVEFEPAAPGKADRAETLQTIRRRLDPVKTVMACVRDLSQRGSFPRCAYPIDFALYGPDAAEVLHWADKLAERLQKVDSLTDVWLDRASQPSRSFYVEADPRQAAMRGVDLSEFDTALEVFFGSTSLAPPFHFFGRALPVEVSVQNAPRPGIWIIDLDSLCVRNSRDEMIRLTTFATVRQRETPLVLDFFNHRPMVQITANPAAGVDLAVARKVCTQMAEETRRKLRLPSEYRLAWLQP